MMTCDVSPVAMFHLVSIGCEVGVAKLEDFDNHDQSNDVPDGGNGQD